MIQDYVITLAQVVFIVNLIPTICHTDQKPPLSTSISTAAMMGVLCFTYASMGWIFSTFSAGVVALEWAVISTQRYRINKQCGLRHFMTPEWVDKVLLRD